MSNKGIFIEHIDKGYITKGDYITMGSAMYEGKTVTNAYVKIPLKTMNRHGLIAGATGTGKTKTLQVLAENLSDKGIPVLLMDLKGDLSGIAQPSAGHAKIDERHFVYHPHRLLFPLVYQFYNIPQRLHLFPRLHSLLSVLFVHFYNTLRNVHQFHPCYM